MKQQKQHTTETPAERLYAFFLRFYPRPYRQAFGSQMLQTFKDAYNDTRETEGRIGIGFWPGVVADEIKSIAREHIAFLIESEQRITLSVLAISVGLIPLLGIFTFFTGDLFDLMIPIILLLGVFRFVQRALLQDSLLSERDRKSCIPGVLLFGTSIGAFLIMLNVNDLPVPLLRDLQGNLQSGFPIIFGENIVPFLPNGLLLLFGMVGFISGQRNKTVQAGTYAGLLAAVVSTVIMLICLPILIALFWHTIRLAPWYTPNTTSHGVWGDNLDGLPAWTFLLLVFGGLLGTLGGALGSHSSRKVEAVE